MWRTLPILLAFAVIAVAAVATEMDGVGVTVPDQGVRHLTDDPIHSIPIPSGGLSIVWVCQGDQNDATLFICSMYEIYEVDPATGTVLNQFPSAEGIHGLAWDGRYLIQNGYNTGTMWFSDKHTGQVYYSQPSPGGYGIAWGKWDNPWDDQWLWVTDFQDQMMYQTDYYTGGSVVSFPVVGGIGAAWDGSHFWDSKWTTAELNRYDPNTGVLLNTISAPQGNPRDICWDGHYLWTVHQESIAWQIDVWLNAGLYPVTQYLNPRYVLTHRGEWTSGSRPSVWGRRSRRWLRGLCT